ncbi:MAG: hypothetical protein KAR57_01200 [Bacteroidales bacterium]|nr:hypothetical protein [Bacteroidales bacterium]
MKIYIFLSIFILGLIFNIKAQYIYPLSEYSSEMKGYELSNFDIQDTILYLPLGESGLHLLDISDISNIQETFVYQEYEKRSRKKVFGTAYNVNVIDNKAYLAYGVLGLKILDVIDPTMPYVLGTYYRYEDVYCSEIFENFAMLGYKSMGLEIVDISNLDNIKMVSRNNIKDFPVKNIQIVPPYIIISGGARGLKIFKFNEPFTKFKSAEFPKSHLTDNEVNKFLIRGSAGYIANDFRGLSVLNMGLPLYPLEVNNIKTNGKAIDLVIDRNYLYVACGKYIEVYDIKEAEKPIKIFEHIDKDKEFKSLKIHDSKLYALYADGSKKYGFVVFQVE